MPEEREAMRTGNEKSQIAKGAGFMKKAKFVLREGANLGWSLERHCRYLCPSVLLGERLAACFRNGSVIQGQSSPILIFQNIAQNFNIRIFTPNPRNYMYSIISTSLKGYKLRLAELGVVLD